MKFVLGLVICGIAWCQPSVPVLYRIGTTLPATCAQGAMFYKTNATSGLGFYICQATNTWVLQSAAGGDTIPAGTVAFFSLGSCPTGWSPYTAAQGRYIVGLPSSGTLEGTSGTALSNLEARTSGTHNHTATQASHTHSATEEAHTHTLTDPGHRHDTGMSGWYGVSGAKAQVYGTSPNTYVDNNTYQAIPAQTYTATTGITIGNATPTITVPSATPSITVNNSGSVSGTPAPYVQLLTCKKD